MDFDRIVKNKNRVWEEIWTTEQLDYLILEWED